MGGRDTVLPNLSLGECVNGSDNQRGYAHRAGRAADRPGGDRWRCLMVPQVCTAEQEAGRGYRGNPQRTDPYLLWGACLPQGS